MEQILLTVAIPTYNRAKLLNKCLNALVAQITASNMQKIEIIVSNNNSPDNTDIVVQQFIDKGFDIGYHKNAENLGADRNIAACFMKAKGKYVWILSDDDFLLPGYLRYITDLLETNEWGDIYLSSRWYNGKYRSDNDTTDTPSYTVYNNAMQFIERVNYWCTFISGNIVNKKLLDIDELYLADYCNSHLVQLSWVLPVIFKGKPNVVIDTPAIACKANNTGGYNLFKVFGKNLNKLIGKLISEKAVDPELKKVINKHLLLTFFPSFLHNNASFKNTGSLNMMISVYWKYPLFWTKIFPRLFKLQFLTTSTPKRLLAKLFYSIINSGYYQAIEQEKRVFKNQALGFKFLGNNSSIPDNSIVKNAKYISIGENFTSLHNLRLEAWDEYEGFEFEPELIIGDNVNLNSDVHIGCINKVSVGNNVLMASKIFITDHVHGETMPDVMKLPPVKRPLFSKGPVIIEDNVWIGEGVSVLSGVTIGKNSIVGANSVVTKSFPANSIIAGVPAKLIKSV